MLIPAAPDTIEGGYLCLGYLSRRGWSIVITADRRGGIVVEASRDGETIRVSGASVDSCAARVFRQAMGFRSFAA